MSKNVSVELYHKTSHEVMMDINGESFIFEDSVSQREYDLGARIWDAVKKQPTNKEG